VLSGDDDASKIDALTANLKTSDGNDSKGEGASSVEPIARSLIGSNESIQTDPSATDRAAFGAPSASGHKQKCPPTIPKCK
jgi:hypothetical protein